MCEFGCVRVECMSEMDNVVWESCGCALFLQVMVVLIVVLLFGPKFGTVETRSGLGNYLGIMLPGRVICYRWISGHGQACS